MAFDDQGYYPEKDIFLYVGGLSDGKTHLRRVHAAKYAASLDKDVCFTQIFTEKEYFLTLPYKISSTRPYLVDYGSFYFLTDFDYLFHILLEDKKGTSHFLPGYPEKTTLYHVYTEEGIIPEIMLTNPAIVEEWYDQFFSDLSSLERNGKPYFVEWSMAAENTHPKINVDVTGNHFKEILKKGNYSFPDRVRAVWHPITNLSREANEQRRGQVDSENVIAGKISGSRNEALYQVMSGDGFKRDLATFFTTVVHIAHNMQEDQIRGSGLELLRSDLFSSFAEIATSKFPYVGRIKLLDNRSKQYEGHIIFLEDGKVLRIDTEGNLSLSDGLFGDSLVLI